MILDGPELKQAIIKFSDAWVKKIRKQNNVYTFRDHIMELGLKLITERSEEIPWDEGVGAIVENIRQLTEVSREEVERFLEQISSWHIGRLTDYKSRHPKASGYIPSYRSSIGHVNDVLCKFDMSQGAFQCLQWKDHTLYKSVFDLAIYQMLIWEAKPKTIIELGSGDGGSAIWMSDMITMYNLDCEIISMDINPVKTSYDKVNFIGGDSYQISKALPEEVLSQLPHPWVFIEDAHQNIIGVLNYFDQFLKVGDYLIVEDSFGPKQGEIEKFVSTKKDRYKIDTHYCDFFGHNITSAENSIFQVVKPS